MVYVDWKKGSRFNANAGLVAEELNSLKEKTAYSALELAKNPSTEIHKCATWDDSKAATSYRLYQMRSVINSIVVIEKEEDEEPIEYRLLEYVSVQKKAENEDEEDSIEKHFITTKEALRNPVFKQQILGDIKQAISALSRKANIYKYLADDDFETVQYHLDLANEAIKI